MIPRTCRGRILLHTEKALLVDNGIPKAVPDDDDSWNDAIIESVIGLSCTTLLGVWNGSIIEDANFSSKRPGLAAPCAQILLDSA